MIICFVGETTADFADVSRAADCGFFCDWLTMPPWPVLDFSMLLKFPAANTTSRVSDGLPGQELPDPLGLLILSKYPFYMRLLCSFMVPTNVPCILYKVHNVFNDTV